MNNNRIARAIDELQRVMREESVDPRRGLTEELFIFATTLIPCANVDLLIKDEDEHSEGYVKWFDYYPNDLLQAHKDLYGDILKGIWKK